LAGNRETGLLKKYLFPEHRCNPNNKPYDHNDRDDAHRKTGFKDPSDHGATAQAK
jgi:hypothetical protein